MNPFGRGDGTRVRKLPLLRRFMPFLMPGRNESAVYFEQTFRVEGTLAWLARVNSNRQARRMGFFHVVLAAVVRTLVERPQLHRFIVGRRVYQRRKLELSFAVKKSFDDAAPLTTVKVRFEPTDTLNEIPARIDAAIQVGRGREQTASEKEMRFVARLPRALLRLVMWGQRFLDYFGLLPGSMIRSDPLYASAFLANLGSLGIDAPFHHLYEYGTVPIFVAIGRIRQAPVVDANGELAVGQVVTLRYTFDERIADGFYCARSLERFQQLIQNPALLEERPEVPL